ncbi:GIY-YIG nuclease family protein [Bacillus toyonensis]|uniref:GIY-YIG nuclease family protein n=1 Tax=Bacillus toyonensis TaxID=155322 RepID=UPI003465E5E2
MRISDFYQLNRVSKYGGVYALWNKDNKLLYIGYASVFGKRFPHHYEYLKPIVYSISIYPTDKHRLLEYTLIQRMYPLYNRHWSWNEITRGQYGQNPYLMDEYSYWGHKFFKKSEYPFKFNSTEDYEYHEGLIKLVNELKSFSKRII